MKRIMAVGVFDLLHAGHLPYLEQPKALGDHLTVVIAHDDTVRKRKHEPVTIKSFANAWSLDSNLWMKW